MVHPLLKDALARRYEAVKVQHPTEGRRRWSLRVLYESWPALVNQPTSKSEINPGVQASFETDSDPLDALLEDEEIGLIVRTDFTNDEAWNAFRQKVQTAQKELLSDLSGASSSGQDASSSNSQGPTESANIDDDESSDESSDELPDIVKIIDPSDEADRQRLTNISNIAALRLFNDVDIRPAPPLGAGAKRISPQHPLIDQGGWQEIYVGKNIWIYDSISNKDECVRVVSQEGDFYGTATGDSWRARASHICELQFNMSYQGLKIDFNGLDKWDYSERSRNLQVSSIL